jgi:RHS repeat-associated protein
VEFYYDSENYRYKKSTNTYDKYYIGKEYEETEYKNNKIEQRSFIYANGKVIATYTKTIQDDNEIANTNYLYSDNLNSIDTIVNNQGEVLQRFAYKPFGKKLNLDIDGNQTDTISKTNRGYTGHEDIEEDDDLVNMNARLYDSTLGRFISADTLIPNPYNTQSFNRYSYVQNNPLKYIDPSGHSSVKPEDVGSDWILYNVNENTIVTEYATSTRYDLRTTYSYRYPYISHYPGWVTVNFLYADTTVLTSSDTINHGFNEKGYNDTFENIRQTIPNQKFNLYGDTRTRYQKNEDNGLNKLIQSLQQRQQYIKDNPSYSHQKAQRLAVMWSVATAPMAVVNAPKVYGVGMNYVRSNPQQLSDFVQGLDAKYPKLNKDFPFINNAHSLGYIIRKAIDAN